MIVFFQNVCHYNLLHFTCLFVFSSGICNEDILFSHCLDLQ
uniref:Uncharacterized protein n=1 Tax=Arundo donax TaxID=35708 RepID=A0A0A9FST2_ARUDO